MKPTKKEVGNKPKQAARVKPNKVGRPSLGRDARNVPLTLKLTMNEKRFWEKRAKGLGMKLHEYILHHLRTEVDTEGNDNERV